MLVRRKRNASSARSRKGKSGTSGRLQQQRPLSNVTGSTWNAADMVADVSHIMTAGLWAVRSITVVVAEVDMTLCPVGRATMVVQMQSLTGISLRLKMSLSLLMNVPVVMTQLAGIKMTAGTAGGGKPAREVDIAAAQPPATAAAAAMGPLHPAQLAAAVAAVALAPAAAVLMTRLTVPGRARRQVSVTAGRGIGMMSRHLRLLVAHQSGCGVMVSSSGQETGLKRMLSGGVRGMIVPMREQQQQQTLLEEIGRASATGLMIVKLLAAMLLQLRKSQGTSMTAGGMTDLSVVTVTATEMKGTEIEMVATDMLTDTVMTGTAGAGMQAELDTGLVMIPGIDITAAGTVTGTGGMRSIGRTAGQAAGWQIGGTIEVVTDGKSPRGMAAGVGTDQQMLDAGMATDGMQIVMVITGVIEMGHGDHAADHTAGLTALAVAAAGAAAVVQALPAVAVADLAAGVVIAGGGSECCGYRYQSPT